MFPQAGLGPFLSTPLQFSVPHLKEIQRQGSDSNGNRWQAEHYRNKAFSLIFCMCSCNYDLVIRLLTEKRIWSSEILLKLAFNTMSAAGCIKNQVSLWFTSWFIFLVHWFKRHNHQQWLSKCRACLPGRLGRTGTAGGLNGGHDQKFGESLGYSNVLHMSSEFSTRCSKFWLHATPFKATHKSNSFFCLSDPHFAV